MTLLIDDAEFKNEVNLDLRGDKNADREWLEENLPSWEASLKTIKRSIETQMSRLKADIALERQKIKTEQDRANFESFYATKMDARSDSLRILGAVETRLTYISMLILDSESTTYYN